MKNKLYIAMYHYTRDLANSRYPAIKGLDIELFRKQLDFFAKNFNVVTMENVIGAWNSDVELPENALLLTFDDGYIDNFLVAFPLLKERGFQGSFFIPGKTFAENVLLDVNKIHFILACAKNSEELMQDVLDEMDNFGLENLKAELIEKYAVANRFDDRETVFVKRVLQTALPENIRNEISSKLFKNYVGITEDKFARELYMNRDQIKLMKNSGMFIGLHGYDHYWLANLPVEQMHADIDKSLDTMAEFIDKNCWVMNYPYGNNNSEVVSYIEQKGCKLGLTTEVRVAGGADNKFLLPRFDCNDFPPKSENYKKF